MINPLNSYICALDIGSSKIAAVLAKTSRGRINEIIFDCIPAKGIKRGVITDSIEVVNAITRLLKNLAAKSQTKIKFLYTNISGQDIITKYSRAIMPLAEKGNKVITLSDIRRINEQARVLGSSLEDEIIHSIPLSYTVDSKSNIINPLGLYSHRLEVDLYLVCAKLSSLQSLNRAIGQSGFEIKDLFFSGLATAKVALDDELKEGLNLFCDIGSDVTEILIFKDGALCAIEVLPCGGDDVTMQLQEVLKMPFELAEDIKRSYGIIGDFQQIEEDKEILVKKSDLYKPVKQRFVAQIVTEKSKSICLKIKEAVEKKVPLYELNNFVVCGRSILAEGFIEALENTLGVAVRLARINDLKISESVRNNDAVSGHKYLAYLTALGMLTRALQERPFGIIPLQQPAKNFALKALEKFKEVYQEYF
jgi:cell division protein FtsA